jgi:putative copper export protein
MLDGIKIAALGVATFFFAMAANYGQDQVYQIHAFLLMLVSAFAFFWTIRKPARARASSPPAGQCPPKPATWTV